MELKLLNHFRNANLEAIPKIIAITVDARAAIQVIKNGKPRDEMLSLKSYFALSNAAKAGVRIINKHSIKSTEDP